MKQSIEINKKKVEILQIRIDNRAPYEKTQDIMGYQILNSFK